MLELKLIHVSKRGPWCVFADMSAWSKHYVPDVVLDALGDLGFASPMPIQSLVLPHAIRDRLDIVGAAETVSDRIINSLAPERF